MKNKYANIGPKKRRAIVFGYMLGALEDPKVPDARKDKIARTLLGYVATKKSARTPKVPKGFDSSGMPKGKKARRQLEAHGNTKGGKWDGLLPTNENFN